MKRKPSPETVADPQVLAAAQKFVFDAKPPATFQCRVCSEPGASEATEGLCWVCRRLKVSAWREVEIQMPLNE